MLKFLSTFLLTFGLVFALPQASAETAPATSKTTKKKVAKKTVKKKSAAKAESEAVEHDGDVPDTTGFTSVSYSCELGNNLTIFQKKSDDKQIAVRWRDRLHRLLRVNTTTGADRYENAKNGLTWVGIPAKGILLNSKNGKQLANECKDAVQLKHST
ncbi:MAG: hypothetical protein H6R04_1620 [Burkholderiaceae bacterium]|nr:hypothetical protein [Burkholderiaceae bacterium]